MDGCLSVTFSKAGLIVTSEVAAYGLVWDGVSREIGGTKRGKASVVSLIIW